MESVFLACFLFGALFTVASTVLGSFGHGAGHEGGAHAGNGHAGHVHLPHGNGAPGHAGHLPHVAGAHVAGAHGDGDSSAAAHGVSSLGALKRLPLLNFSSLVAFMTWFGAAGYVLTRYAGWAPAGAIAVATVAGALGALLVAAFLGRVMAGERVMNAREYRLPGTIARVTVGISTSGVGEIVFIKGGVRRSEAARSVTGQPIARDTEVVILDYGQGTARVQPWAELLAESPPATRLPAAGTPGQSADSGA